MSTLLFIHVFEILGIISFAVSGAMSAIKRKLDLLGVVFIGFSTAVAGGIMRDVFLGYTPPRIFFNYGFIIISFVSSVIVFIIYRLSINNFIRKKKIFLTKFNLLIDTVGLAVFSVVGVQLALELPYSENIFIAILSGFLTAVGGGIVRDVLCNQVPFVFKGKELYATAAIAGSLIYYMLVKSSLKINTEISSIISILVIIILRVLAITRRLRMPHIHK